MSVTNPPNGFQDHPLHQFEYASKNSSPSGTRTHTQLRLDPKSSDYANSSIELSNSNLKIVFNVKLFKNIFNAFIKLDFSVVIFNYKKMFK